MPGQAGMAPPRGGGEDDRTKGPPGIDIAQYVADLTRELAAMVEAYPDLSALAYLLDIARLEAEAQVQRLSGL